MSGFGRPQTGDASRPDVVGRRIGAKKRCSKAETVERNAKMGISTYLIWIERGRDEEEEEEDQSSSQAPLVALRPSRRFARHAGEPRPSVNKHASTVSSALLISSLIEIRLIGAAEKRISGRAARISG